MTAVTPYFVISSLCVFFGYVLYRIFLYKQTDFRSIRYYLLLVMIASLVVPLVNFKLPSSLIDLLQLGKRANLSSTYPDFAMWSSRNGAKAEGSINYLQIVSIAYLSISALFFCRMLLQVSSLALCIYKSKKVNKEDYTLVFNQRFKGSFSFFRWIFINENLQYTKETNVIIAHEVAHCKQLHTMDVLLAELITTLFWFNPFVWKIKDAVKLNHEYLADQSVLRSGVIPSAEYQVILLNQVAGESLISYVSGFNGNVLKNRILMMLAAKNKAKLYTHQTIVISICCVLVIVSITGFINVNNHTVINQQQKTKKVNLDELPISKRKQNSAADSVTVQSIPSKKVKNNKKIASSNQVTVEDIKINR